MQPSVRALPQLLTAIRLSFALPLAAALHGGDLPLAAALLSLAIITDLLDGWLARRLDACSTFGGYFDAIADFVLVTAAFGALTARGVYPPWMLLIIGLMFAQFILTSASKQPVHDPIGKYYGAALYSALLALALLPDWLLSDTLLVGIVVLSAVSLSTRAFWLAQMSAIQR